MEAPTPGIEARVLALGVLFEYQERDAFLGSVLSSGLGASDLDRRDRALVTELVQGTVRMKLALDWVLKEFSNRPLESLDPLVLWVLRLSAFQMMFMSVPDYAAVDMAARTTAELVGQHAVGFVNAVMRAFARGHEKVAFPLKEENPAAYLETRYSHPRWVVEMWIDELGLEKAESICEADNREPALSLRTNLRRASRESLAASLAEKGIEVEPGEMTPECLNVKGSGYLRDLDEYQQGLFSVQDQGSQLVSHQVDPRAGMSVLDMCAAPGGKANHLAELMGNSGSVVAVDRNGTRLRLVSEAAERLGNSIVKPFEMDATEASAALETTFERVLVDAPCTGLGTLARRPDVRWRKKHEDIVGLVELQGRLLAEAAKMVEPHGLLVYSTCTISQRENAGVVGAFLEQAPGFGVEASRLKGCEVMPSLQLFPDTDRCDGIFMAVMRRLH